MKLAHRFLVFFLLTAWAGSAAVAPAPAPPATSSATPPASGPLRLVEPWSMRRADLVVLPPRGAAQTDSKVRRILVRDALYETRTGHLAGITMLLYPARTTADDQLSLVFVRWASLSDFYVADARGVWACLPVAGWPEQLTFSREFLALNAVAPEPGVEQMEKTVDWDNFRQLSERDSFKISLVSAAPAGFFGFKGVSAGPELDQLPVFNGVGGVEGGFLRLDYYCPSLRMPASFWVDFAARKVVRGVVGGHEMKLGVNGAPGTAVDGTNLVTPEMQAWYNYTKPDNPSISLSPPGEP